MKYMGVISWMSVPGGYQIMRLGIGVARRGAQSTG